ncbi:Major surface antigen 4 precursor [Anaplasma phagocytophilum]|uniref:Major surface antigen 4 n=1 Tax=Anaplasma phagocytophilum TaxID=948 RepID=A0AA45UU49_ANAPH|nr:Major surface antigen 4 precursor [Anaplasma phagocytophilum]SBO32865.1 Major surface antigen 4 precursor [Anaplasma phagocytophilum]SBO32893.1 Major surface antigen 4 precursor [Anaplasma phagocytophilum]SBO33530.1 Major surface antigen 4 precursor [Anaplasma phagocytophilum]SBO33949.1 Major surface antigen 4 precursor [Anaplasma phagocytophilum]
MMISQLNYLESPGISRSYAITLLLKRKTKGIRDSGSKEDEADTVYLLAKELAYDVVTDQEKRLGDALAKYEGKDIARFAKALNISNSEIDKKICDGSHAKGKKNEPNNTSIDGYGYYNEKDPQANKTAQCSGLQGTSAGKRDFSLSKFANDTRVEKGENWPTGYMNEGGGNKINVKGEANSNAEAVAKDLVKLTHDEKTKVAGLLAKTIEGGEVVEIRAVSSTSVMVNACYDLLTEGLGVVPYACVGLGGNFVGVVDEYSTIRL